MEEDPGKDIREERGMVTLNTIGADITETSTTEGTNGLTHTNRFSSWGNGHGSGLKQDYSGKANTIVNIIYITCEKLAKFVQYTPYPKL
jgi:hypothetical protein